MSIKKPTQQKTLNHRNGRKGKSHIPWGNQGEPKRARGQIKAPIKKTGTMKQRAAKDQTGRGKKQIYAKKANPAKVQRERVPP